MVLLLIVFSAVSGKSFWLHEVWFKVYGYLYCILLYLN